MFPFTSLPVLLCFVLLCKDVGSQLPDSATLRTLVARPRFCDDSDQSGTLSRFNPSFYKLLWVMVLHPQREKSKTTFTLLSCLVNYHYLTV